MVQELRVKKIKPALNYLTTTAVKFTAEECAEMSGGVIRSDMLDVLKPHQTITSVSDRALAQGFAIGQIVYIDITRYGRPVQKRDSIKSSMDEHYNAQIKYSIPNVEIDGEEHLLLSDGDIKFTVLEYDMVDYEQKKSSTIIENDNQLIVPGKNIIV